MLYAQRYDFSGISGSHFHKTKNKNHILAELELLVHVVTVRGTSPTCGSAC